MIDPARQTHRKASVQAVHFDGPFPFNILVPVEVLGLMMES